MRACVSPNFEILTPALAPSSRRLLVIELLCYLSWAIHISNITALAFQVLGRQVAHFSQTDPLNNLTIAIQQNSFIETYSIKLFFDMGNYFCKTSATGITVGL